MQHLHDPNQTLWKGPEPGKGSRAMILLHGRGSSPQDILGLTSHLQVDGMTLAAPSANRSTWYPQSFLAPEAANQPGLDSALSLVQGTMSELEEKGVASEDIYVLGFSQGACLALESVARRPARYGGVFALSGGLIGLGVNQRTFTGSLDGTPVFMGCSDVDPHIPKDRFEESARVLRNLGAEVQDTLYPGFGHSVNEDEVEQINRILKGA